MQWLLDNWLIVLLFGGMIAMHLFGHGGHGGHGGGSRRGKHDHDGPEPTENVADTAQPHSHDKPDATPKVGGSRAAVAPARAAQVPEPTDEL